MEAKTTVESACVKCVSGPEVIQDPTPTATGLPWGHWQGCQKEVNRETEATQEKSRKVILVVGPCPNFIDCIIIK